MSGHPTFAEVSAIQKMPCYSCGRPGPSNAARAATGFIPLCHTCMAASADGMLRVDEGRHSWPPTRMTFERVDPEKFREWGELAEAEIARRLRAGK